MRKMRSIICASLLCLMLCACGTDTAGSASSVINSSSHTNTSSGAHHTTGMGTVGQPTQGDLSAAEKDHDLKVHVTVNPEFELYLDAERIVTAVRCLNYDAVDLFKTVSVVNQTYDAAMEVILNAAFDEGYVAEDAVITIQPVMPDGTTATKQIEEELRSAAVVKFESDKEITLKVDTAPTSDGDTTSSGEKEAQYEEIKSADKVVQSVLRLPSGEVVTTEYTEEGALYSETVVDAAGREIRKTYRMTDGTYHSIRHKYDKNGALIEKTRLDDTAGTRVTYFYENDVIVKEISRYEQEGRSVEITYHDYDKGITAMYREEKDDGSYQETSYQPDGKESAYKGLMADGRYMELTYHSNGNRAFEKTESPDGSYTQYTYHTNGNLATYKEMEADGDCYEASYSQNGELIDQRTYNVKGGLFDEESYDEIVRDEAGNVIKTVKGSDSGTKITVLYNGKGDKVSEITEWTDERQGRIYQELVYNADGSIAKHIHQTTKNNVTERQESTYTYHANGKVATETVKGKDG